MMADIRYILVEDKIRRLLIFIFVTVVVSTLCGAVFGCISRLAGWGFSGLAIFVGLSVGLAAEIYRWSDKPQQLVTCVISLIPGLILFAWVADKPPWKAQTAIPENQVDDLCIRVCALRLCRERQIIGVFDFNDVPEEICSEAGLTVKEMSFAEKLSLCNNIFGKRINAPQTSDGLSWVIWIFLTLAAAVTPFAIRARFFHGPVYG